MLSEQSGMIGELPIHIEERFRGPSVLSAVDCSGEMY